VIKILALCSLKNSQNREAVGAVVVVVIHIVEAVGDAIDVVKDAV
jgi:hypothetical protein